MSIEVIRHGPNNWSAVDRGKAKGDRRVWVCKGVDKEALKKALAEYTPR